MSLNELHVGRGISESSAGFGRTRTWRGLIMTVDQAKSDPDAPRFNDPHPDDPNLVVSNASFVPEGPHVLVRANYVDSIFQDSTPPENQTDEEWTQINTTFEDVDVDIPIFELVTKQFPTASGGSESKDIWQIAEQTATFRYARAVHRITLNATVMGGAGVATQLAISSAINEQTNKLHRIGGAQYLFKADNVSRTAEDQYQFTYRWLTDPGVPNTLGPLFTASYSPNLKEFNFSSFAYPVYDDDFIIPPFHRLDYGPSSSDPSDAPEIAFSLQYVENDNGHLTLPGVA